MKVRKNWLISIMKLKCGRYLKLLKNNIITCVSNPYTTVYIICIIYDQTHSNGNHDITVITHNTIDNFTCDNMVSTITDAVMACSSCKIYVIVNK